MAEVVQQQQRGGKRARQAGAGETANKRHVATEQKRRDRINEGFSALQALLPTSAGAEKATLLMQAAEYVKQLQSAVRQLLEAAEAKLPEELRWTLQSLLPPEVPQHLPPQQPPQLPRAPRVPSVAPVAVQPAAPTTAVVYDPVVHSGNSLAEGLLQIAQGEGALADHAAYFQQLLAQMQSAQQGWNTESIVQALLLQYARTSALTEGADPQGEELGLVEEAGLGAREVDPGENPVVLATSAVSMKGEAQRA